jgi:micrococcal nuclease
MKKIVIIALASFSSLCQAKPAQVISVTDGDTLTARIEGVARKVRIAAIDAPEIKQPFGVQSKQTLVNLCAGKSAEVTGDKLDKYSRVIASVSCNGTDVGTHMVKNGMAMVYDRYVNGHQYLYAHQNAAKNGKRGMWSGSPIKPWEWRRNK